MRVAFASAALLCALLTGCSATGQPAAPASAAPSLGSRSPASSPAPTDRPASSAAPSAANDPSADARLLRAAAAGDVAAVRAALEAGADVEAVDDTGATALVLAAYGNHVDVARALVDAGADVNHKDRTEQSAYLISTSEVGDDPRLLDLMLASGARVQAKDSFNGTGLIRAAERGFPVIVDRLLDAGIQVDHVNELGWTALHEAIILGKGSRAPPASRAPADRRRCRRRAALAARRRAPDRARSTTWLHQHRDPPTEGGPRHDPRLQAPERSRRRQPGRGAGGSRRRRRPRGAGRPRAHGTAPRRDR